MACTSRATNLTLKQMQHQVAQNKHIIQQLQRDLATLRTLQSSTNGATSTPRSEAQSKVENAQLQRRVKELQHDVYVAEMLNGERQILPPTFSLIPKAGVESLPAAAAPASAPAAPKAAVAAPKEGKKPAPAANGTAAPALSSASKPAQPSSSKAAPPKKAAEPESGTSASASGEASGDVHVGRLDMRVGRIVEVMKHPDADSLYVEKVDVGEPNPRSIVSGLVKHVPLEQMQQRLAVFLCNLKPAKMRNVMSEGMIMCASCAETGTVQILEVPPGCVPGDRIYVPAYEATPDVQMNPKKKILETVKPDLRVNAEGVACYKNVPWEVRDGKGRVKAPSVKDAQIQ